MRVCIFTTAHRTFDKRVFHKEARSLVKAGYHVTLLVHAPFKQEIHDGVCVKGIKPASNRFFRLLNIFYFIKECLRCKADVYHFQDFELLPAGLFLKIITRKPVIYDCHENFPETVYERVWYPDWLKPILHNLIASMEPAIARRMDAVICVVPDQVERFTKRGCNPLLVRNYPQFEIFDKILDQNPAKLNQLVYLGGITIVRGARILVEIMAELKQKMPGLSLLMLGPYNEPFVEQEINNYIKELNVQDIIRHIPLVPHEQVPEYLAQSLLGLIPWQESKQTLRMVAPNKVFEYMMCSLPVISSDLPSLQKYINNSHCGVLVKADDSSAYVESIIQILANPEKMAELGKHGREYVREHYNWKSEEKSLINLYKSLEK